MALLLHSLSPALFVEEINCHFLFIIFLDPLREGLHQNPLFNNIIDGITVLKIDSKGFADDTFIVSDTIEGLILMHLIMLAFCKFNYLQLNGGKTELVGRDVDGNQWVNQQKTWKPRRLVLIFFTLVFLLILICPIRNKVVLYNKPSTVIAD